MRNTVVRIVCFFVQLVLAGFLFVPVHEQSHFLMAKWLGVSGYVVFNFQGGGAFRFTDLAACTLSQNALITAAGGLGAGLFAALLWLTSDLQKNVAWAAIFSMITVVQVLYGICELVAIWHPAAADWGQVVAALAAYGTAILLYSGKVRQWWGNASEMAKSMAKLPE